MGPTGLMSIIHRERYPQRRNTLRMGPLFRDRSLSPALIILAIGRRMRPLRGAQIGYIRRMICFDL